MVTKGGWGIVIGLFVLGLLTQAWPPVKVAITSPPDGISIVHKDEIAIVVQFHGNWAIVGERGRVKTLILEIGGVEVARHENTPAVRKGTHTFFVDISSYPKVATEIVVRSKPRGEDRITVRLAVDRFPTR